jgi:predicted histone-like DNA-binding protein
MEDNTMAIHFKLTARRNPSDQTAPQKYYAQAVTTGKRNLKLLAQRIADNTTMGIGDIHGVLLSLEQEIVYAMEDGASVELGDICFFYPTVQSEGVENASDFNATAHIKKKSIRIKVKQSLGRKIAEVPVQKIS